MHAFDSLQRRKYLRLLIVVKAKIGDDGFCYIGWDMDGHKLVRPVLRQGSCRWLAKDKDLRIGEKHLFGIINPQPEGMYPQRTNDVLVNYINPCDPSESNSDDGELYDILVDEGHQTVKEVFGNMEDFNGKYVLQRTKCPSVGIYKCQKKSLIIDGEPGKRRCKSIDGELFDYSITAVDDKLPNVADDDDVLVMLGLTRPSSSLKHYQYRNKCGIIVVGFVAKCKYAQQHFPVECQHDYEFSSPEKPEDGGNTHEITEAILPSSITMGRKRKWEMNYAIKD
ncbi:hypothetical protein OS493_022443 [Desmophyllum pertusum]|uniref:Uncharacterized protein n=1 Tax=Desmophyllum pertusum TaxID=174260 RepID=A0A9W9ZMB5_9CNID|nr:hypothetical protein OS493_022443 [Desmophyllum pertusum]